MKLRLLIILSLLVSSWGIGLRSVHFGSTEPALTLEDTTAYTVSDQLFSGLQQMTGILIAGPNPSTRSKRSEIMGRNQEYIYGWLYDLTDKRAKKWLRSREVNKLRSKEVRATSEHINSSNFSTFLIMENNKFQQFGDDFKERQEYFSGYAITLYPDAKLGVSFTHAKTFVGDKRRVIQTANLTHSSLNFNVEHFFFGTDPKIREDLLTLWQLDQFTILSNGKSNKKGYTDRLRSASPNLLVCPLNCRQKIEFLMRHATRSIWISQQYITDARILDILQSQTALDIRIHTNDMSSNYELFDRLGGDIVRLRKEPYSHDKMMIIDGKIALIGSMNFSDNALDNNREIGILTTDKTVITRLVSEF